MKDLVQLTNAAYHSIVTKYEHEVIIVDDWSEEDSKGFLRALEIFDNVHLITDPLTLSLSEKWNLAAEKAWELGCDAVLICNNDILFHPVTIDAIVERWQQDDVGMVTAHNLRGQVEPDKLNEVAPPENPTEAPNPDFSCFLLPKETWNSVGIFDAEFRPCYFEDNDYHYRMKLLGLKAITTTAAIYYHYGSQTQNSVPGGLCRGEQFQENYRYFVKKHGVDPSTYLPVSE